MDKTNASIAATWPRPAKDALARCDAWFQTIAAQADTGPLDARPKWGQPSWRPKRPRTGSTLRLNWSPDAPDVLTAYVDCKTDLAIRMSDIYPDIPNDRSRAMTFDLCTPLPKDMLCHLAAMTFTYHQKR